MLALRWTPRVVSKFRSEVGQGAELVPRPETQEEGEPHELVTLDIVQSGSKFGETGEHLFKIARPYLTSTISWSSSANTWSKSYGLGGLPGVYQSAAASGELVEVDQTWAEPAKLGLTSGEWLTRIAPGVRPVAARALGGFPYAFAQGPYMLTRGSASSLGRFRTHQILGRFDQIWACSTKLGRIAQI